MGLSVDIGGGGSGFGFSKFPDLGWRKHRSESGGWVSPTMAPKYVYIVTSDKQTYIYLYICVSVCV